VPFAFAAPAPADTVLRSIDVDGRTRTYLVHVPRALDRAKPAPLVFVFHGAGCDATSLVRATGLDALADREGFVVVYPNAVGPGRTFDVSAGPSNDVRFVDLLLARLRGRLAVDLSRVHATGFSNGAAFCYRLGAERASVFASVAPVAGYLSDRVAPGSARPASLLHAHGTADPRVPLQGPRDVMRGVARWAAWRGCRGEPSVAPAPDLAPVAARRVAYACPEGAAVELLLFPGAGHDWPGGPGGPLTRAIWAFFRAHSRA
jgi:polyhydroxybutyrate depolymerase